MIENNYVKQINKILNIDESYKATDRMWEIIYNRNLREQKMRELLKLFDYDVSFDWFKDYFEQEQAERKTKKQDFTPQCITKLLSKLVGHSSKNYDVCCGTGGITITKWYDDMTSKTVFEYSPSDYMYYCEELSDRAIPFLLFNLAVRGMNALVIQCDVLTRQSKGVWFIFNEEDNYLGFSTINLMPYNSEVEKEFNINFIEQKYKSLIESKEPILEDNNEI